MSDWRDVAIDEVRPGIVGYAVGALRIAALGGVTYAGLALLLVLRLVERPVCGASRPITPFVTQAVCRAALAILGLRLGQHGRPSRVGAAVCNHVSWLDIFVLGACDRVYFVAKSEVSGWPGIGWLARATGTAFITRKGSEAAAQRVLMEHRLAAGHRLLFFPEGTSTDGNRVLAFKSTLFAAFFSEALRDTAQVQPVSLRYRAPKGLDARFYGWWGDMAFGPHLWRIAVTPRGGRVEVVWHPPLATATTADRKALAAACEAEVRAGFEAAGDRMIPPGAVSSRSGSRSP